MTFIKGHKVSEQTKEKISLSEKGKVVSEETKEKMRNKVVSLETRKKLSLAGIGRISANKGKKMTEEQKQKIKATNIIKMKSPEIRKKISNSLKGERSLLWRGGITKTNLIVRQNVEARLWREAIFARDSYTCQNCFQLGSYLNAHHIRNFSEEVSLRFAIDNGITFCKPCHKIFHKRYGNRNNNIKQVIEFLKKKEVFAK